MNPLNKDKLSERTCKAPANTDHGIRSKVQSN